MRIGLSTNMIPADTAVMLTPRLADCGVGVGLGVGREEERSKPLALPTLPDPS